MTELLLLTILHAFATLLMTGLIWFVQLVHYPLFAYVGREVFSGYEQQHTRRTTWIVAPLMGLELISACLLPLMLSDATAVTAAYIGVALVAVIWFSTAFVQVPCHARLVRSFDDETARRLVTTNWIRTVAWTARSALALWFVQVAATA